MALIGFANEEAWHQLRAQYIGASEIAGLFNISPWTTKWKLYMQKTGQLKPVDEKQWMSRGRHFEPAIASYAGEVFDLQVQKVKDYWTDDACPGLGASFDYTLANDPGVPVEIKWVERYDGWDWDGDELTKIPDYYLLQVQHQMACSSAPYGILIAFVGGTVRYMYIPRSDALISAIRTQVMSFWEDVRAGKEPPVDFLKDADSIIEMANYRPLRSIELPTSAAGLFEEYLHKTTLYKQAEDDRKAAQAELVKMVTDAGPGDNTGKTVATCGDYRMSLSQVKDNPGKIVSQEMIGEVIGARKGHLRVTISKKEEK